MEQIAADQRDSKIQTHLTLHHQAIIQRTDRLFSWLLLMEWAGAMVAAVWITPRTWIGETSEIHLHVWAAIILGGVIVSAPVYLARTRPGEVVTRHSIAAAQMMMSALLIHATGGRIETHFHIFGSLAFLAFYRDWRVLLTATVVTAVDHVARGAFWPASIYGVFSASQWRWVEHAAWVVFEDIFLFLSCFQAEREMRENAAAQVDVEETSANAERNLAQLQETQSRSESLSQEVRQQRDAAVSFLAETGRVLREVAGRNLKARMQGNYDGEYGQIKDALNLAADNLDSALSQVATGSSQVATAAVEISSASQSLAQRSSEQAGSLEEVARGLQQMTAMTQQNSMSAKQARDMTERAREFSTLGVESMTRLSDAITRIKASADATAKIVRTIDEIAFQTNLLALNAAVEAARAGDAGRGFAVVADEVRSLAMRSAEAAKNTAHLIEESVSNAEGGVKTNLEVITNLNQISEQVRKVNEVVTEIAASSDRQNQDAGQINDAMEQMNSLTQQTAASAEESASASEELSAHAAEMQSLVAKFRLTDTSSNGSRGAIGGNGPFWREKHAAGSLMERPA